MFEPYQDVDTWSRKKLEDELEHLHRDKQNGIMTEDMYRHCYDIILGEILRKEDEDEAKEAYERAMKGL